MLERISRSGQGSFLGVLKLFGTVASPGLLSFPRPGVTLALDFPNQGEPTRRLFEELDVIVREAGGALYPAKDARMRPEDFQRSFPNWRQFAAWKDPQCSSSLWRRVTT
jgi:FAD/FMN-containing dehydrogenase